MNQSSNTQCGELSINGTYYLKLNLTTTDTCFNITAQNVTLDCAGYSITGNNSTSTYGVYSDQINTTVRNCNIQNFSTGIYIDGDSADYANITNNTINLTYKTSCSYSTGVCNAIFLKSADNSTISNNTVSVYEYAIDLYSSAMYNIIQYNNASAINDYAIRLTSSSNNNITNNKDRKSVV